MIVSDAKTPGEFRAEVLQEIDRRLEALKREYDRGPKPMRVKIILAVRGELAALRYFYESVKFQ